MLDTHTVARSLTDAGLTPGQADAITNALRLAVERGDVDTGAVARSLTDAGFTLAQLPQRILFRPTGYAGWWPHAVTLALVCFLRQAWRDTLDQAVDMYGKSSSQS